MTQHRIKCWPEQFQALADGRKHHEVRRNDRNYQVGDTLILEEFILDDPDRVDVGGRLINLGHYTGRRLHREVTWVTQAGTFGLPADVCVMSLTWWPGKMDIQP